MFESGVMIDSVQTSADNFFVQHCSRFKITISNWRCYNIIEEIGRVRLRICTGGGDGVVCDEMSS